MLQYWSRFLDYLLDDPPTYAEVSKYETPRFKTITVKDITITNTSSKETFTFKSMSLENIDMFNELSISINHSEKLLVLNHSELIK